MAWWCIKQLSYRSCLYSYILISDLPQPFVWTKITKRPDEAQREVCGPQSMTFAKFYSMDDVFAYRRLLHERYINYPVVALQKKGQFSTTQASCKKTVTSFSEVANLTQWMVGDPHVTPAFFSDDSVHLSSCTEMCLFASIVGNKFRMDDISCGSATYVICRKSSSELRFCICLSNRYRYEEPELRLVRIKPDSAL